MPPKKSIFQQKKIAAPSRKIRFSPHTFSRFKKYLLGFFLALSVFVLFVIWALGPLRYFVADIPGMVGFGSGKTYLVLFQNNYELRPTGGFISAYARVHFRFGIPSIEFHDSYEIDYLPYRDAPAPLETFLKLDPKYRGWQFRDANFSPDYPTSARSVLTFYNEKYPEDEIAGVFAVNMSFFEKLMDLFGPLEVEGRSFTRESFFWETQRAVKNIDLHNEESLAERKSILGPLSRSLIWNTVFSPWKWNALSNLTAQNLDEKNLLLFFVEEGKQRGIIKKSWAGIFEPQLTPFFYIDSSNIGGRKGDRYLNKHYRYDTVIKDDGTSETLLTVNFRHNGTYHLQSDLYQGYLRLYLPPQAKLISVNGDYWRGLSGRQRHDLEQTQGYTMVGWYMHLFPQEERTVQIRLDMSEIFPKEGDFPLAIFKQPGTDNDLFEISFVTPTHTFIHQKSGSFFQAFDNLLTWKGQLKQNVQTELTIVPDRIAPLITEHLFLDPTIIQLSFDEALDSQKATDVNNYVLKDLNLKHPEVTDSLVIEGIEIPAARESAGLTKNVLIRVSGASVVPEERYELTMKNIADTKGNMISPNPFVVTVIQRQ